MSTPEPPETSSPINVDPTTPLMSGEIAIDMAGSNAVVDTRHEAVEQQQRWTVEQQAWAATLCTDQALRQTILGIARCWHHPDPEGALQDTIIRMTNSSKLARDTPYIAFGAKIARNLCNDNFRRHRRRPELLAPSEEALDYADPHNPIENTEARLFAISLLSDLDPEHRRTLAEFYLLDQPIETVAKFLGIPEGTARSRLNRALKAARLAVKTEGLHS